MHHEHGKKASISRCLRNSQRPGLELLPRNHLLYSLEDSWLAILRFLYEAASSVVNTRALTDSALYILFGEIEGWPSLNYNSHIDRKLTCGY